MAEGQFYRQIRFDDIPTEKLIDAFKEAVKRGEETKDKTFASIAVIVHMNGEEFVQAIKRDGCVTTQVASASRNHTMTLVALLQAFNDLAMEQGTPPALKRLHHQILHALLELHTSAKEST